MAELEEKSRALTARWEKEKDKLGSAQKVKEEIDAPAHRSSSRPQRQGRLRARGRAPVRRHSRAREEARRAVESSCEAQSGRAWLRGGSDARGHRGVVSRWTGIPVDTMLEGEREKLLQMEERSAQRVIGQEEAVEAVSDAVRRARAGLAGSEPADRLVHVPRPDGRRQDRADARRSPSSCSTTRSAMVRIDMSEYMEKHSVSRADRRAAGLRRLRGGRRAHRSRAAPALSASSCSTRSRRRTRTCSTCSCRCSTTGA